MLCMGDFQKYACFTYITIWNGNTAVGWFYSSLMLKLYHFHKKLYLYFQHLWHMFIQSRIHLRDINTRLFLMTLKKVQVLLRNWNNIHYQSIFIIYRNVFLDISTPSHTKTNKTVFQDRHVSLTELDRHTKVWWSGRENMDIWSLWQAT